MSMVVFDDERKEKEFVEIKQREEEELIKFLAEKHGLPYANLATIAVENDALQLLPEAEARTAKIALFAINGRKVSAAIFTPNTLEVQAALKKLETAEYQVELYMASTRSLEKVWGHYKELSHAQESYAGTVDMSINAIKEAAKNIKHLLDVVPEIDAVVISKTQNRITRLVEVILGAAIALDASDIHIEPRKSTLSCAFVWTASFILLLCSTG